MQDNFNIHSWRINQTIKEMDETPKNKIIAQLLGPDFFLSKKPVSQWDDKDHDLFDRIFKMASETGEVPKLKEKFPDLSGDGKITQKDILIAKGVIKKEVKSPDTFTDEYKRGYIEGYKDGKKGVYGKQFVVKEEDHEVSMAQASLKSIVSSATQLMNKLGNNERNIPGWIQDHIVNAENFIDQANQGFHELDNEYEED